MLRYVGDECIKVVFWLRDSYMICNSFSSSSCYMCLGFWRWMHGIKTAQSLHVQRGQRRSFIAKTELNKILYEGVVASSWWRSERERETERGDWLLYFACLPDVLWLLVFCGYSSRYRGLVCSVWLWYFLIILTYFLSLQNHFKHNIFMSQHIRYWYLSNCQATEAQASQSIHCSHTQSMDEDEVKLKHLILLKSPACAFVGDFFCAHATDILSHELALIIEIVAQMLLRN